MERRATQWNVSLQKNIHKCNDNVVLKPCKIASEEGRSRRGSEKSLGSRGLKAFGVGVLKSVSWKDSRYCLQLRIQKRCNYWIGGLGYDYGNEWMR